MNKFARALVLASASTLCTVASTAQADEPERRQALFGDLHVHTVLSFDAYVFGTRRTPDDAYRYALGEPIRHAAGYDIQLKGGPLDFYAVTDHAEYMGVLRALNEPENPLSQIPWVREMFSGVEQGITAVFGKISGGLLNGKSIPEIDHRDTVKSAWTELQAAAERYYRPGKFTTFYGYEYTSMPADQNLHRIVLFRGSRAPDMPFGTFDSPNPEMLWKWLDGLRKVGIEGLAIPHNSNASNGLMFQTTDFAGRPIDAQYAETRSRNEPIVEMTQIKGTSETHPALSPNDEWANFEIFDKLLTTGRDSKADGSYIRQALQRGLLIEQKTGKNPYKFGLIGSSDTHNAGGPMDEDHYFGKAGLADGTPERRGAVTFPENVATNPRSSIVNRWSAAGLAGVWAEQNNREDIYAAFRRKETFATSGPRIKVRLFAGHGYPGDVASRADFAKLAYARGVPMGGDLSQAGKGAPTFLAQAMKDPESAGIERVQIIRGWVEGGELKEKVFDIACDRGKPDSKTHRCAARKPSIDTGSCEIDASDGVAEVKAAWQDPEFDPRRRAFYYLRVIERPTCRWSTWEANRLGLKLRPGLPLTIQERAWSSPIWIGS